MAEIALMDTEEVKAFMDGRKPDEFTLLDVRQPWEYEEFHVPGAMLMPLVDLPDRVDELDREKPVITYCRSGARSMAAATLLQGQDFSHIINMLGGAMAWKGEGAFGPMDLGFIEFSAQDKPVDIVLKAYAMEDNLQRFYIQRSDMAETLERIELFMNLAEFEDKHKNTLFNLYVKLGGDLDKEGFDAAALGDSTEASEGGASIEAFLEQYGEAFDTDHGVLQLAAAVEAQAYDYYLRCARQAESNENRDVFLLLAREEKAHLKLLGKFLDERVEA